LVAIQKRHHAGVFRHRLQGPSTRWIFVHGVDRRTHLTIGQGEKPPDAAPQSFRKMPPQDLNQYHGGTLLCDDKAAWLRLAQLLPHTLQTPAQHHLVRFFADMDDGRQHPQQDAGARAWRRVRWVLLANQAMMERQTASFKGSAAHQETAVRDT
jgi:hypothetical protein